MTAPALFHESINDALKEVVAALGGSQATGLLMKPLKPADESGAWVKDCLNAGRRERFTPDQVLFLLRRGREAGCHAAMNYLAREAGYADPLPVEPEDERARLQREFIEATKAISGIAERLARHGIKVAA